MKDDNARLRAAIDKLRVPIYIKDPQGRYVYANDLACELLECSRTDVLGRSDSELFPPDLADAMQAHDRRAMAGREPVIAEERFRLPGHPEMTWGLSIKQPLFEEDGRPDGVAGLTIDITDVLIQIHSPFKVHPGPD